MNFDIGSTGNSFYNNVCWKGTIEYLDDENAAGLNDYNVTEQVGVRIKGDGPNIGGNVWITSASAGPYFDNADTNTDGFLDDNFTEETVIDYLPLSNKFSDGDSCSYTSGNWNVDCSDVCDFSLTDIGGNSVFMTGSGTVTNINNIINFFIKRASGGCIAKG